MISFASDSTGQRDGRLLIPAAALWLGAAVTLAAVDAGDSSSEVRTRALVSAAAVGAALVLSLVVVAVLIVGMGWAALGGRWRWHLPIALGLLFLLVGAGSAAGRVALAMPSQLAAWADANATAQVAGTVAGEARIRTAGAGVAWGSRSWQEVTVTGDLIHARGRSWEGQSPWSSGSRPKPWHRRPVLECW